MLTIEEQIGRLVDAAMDELDRDRAEAEPPATAAPESPLRTTPVTLVAQHSTPEPSRGRGWLVLIAAAAAALVVLAFVAIRNDDATPADQPSPTVTVPPTVPPRPLPGTLDEPLVPGTYFIDNIDGTPTPRIFITIGEGWAKGWIPSPSVFKTGENGNLAAGDGFMTFSHPVAVFSDPCHWEDGYLAAPVDTVDGLVAVLSEQPGWAAVTAPWDISVDGYIGKAFQRTAPADMSGCDTVSSYGPRVGSPGTHSVFLSWENVSGVAFSGSGPYEPGEVETLWVLDIDGTVVLINTRPWPEASAAARAEFAAVLDSIRIERP